MSAEVCTQKPDRPHADSVGTTIRKFITAPTNLIDLCAIVPFYVEYFFKGGDVKFLKVLRAIRLVRLFRVFKVRRSEKDLSRKFAHHISYFGRNFEGVGVCETTPSTFDLLKSY